MDAPDRAAGESCIGLVFPPLYPSAGSGFIVQLLDLDGGEPFELDSSDGRYDVVFDHVLIGLCGVGWIADIFVLLFKPNPYMVIKKK